TEWTIDGAGSGSANGITSFTGIENLVGGSDTTDDRGSDIFTFQALGSISGTVDGGGGVDMLVGPDAANIWIISGPDAGTLNAAANFVSIEALAGGSADDTFKVMPGGSISAFIDGGTSPDGLATPSVDTLDYSGFGAAVTVDLALGAATGVSANFGIDTYIGSGNAADLFKGPGADGDSIPWTISGPDAGSVQGVSFSSFANLKGQDGAADAFFFTKTGSLSGTLDGGGTLGDGIIDGLSVSQNVAGDDVVAIVPETINPETATIDGRVINYVGLDPYSPLGGNASHVVINGSPIGDKITVEDANPGVDDGKLLITYQNVAFRIQSIFGLGPAQKSFIIDSPVPSGVPGDDPPSLTIITGAGGDTITIKSLDPMFAADLLIYGSYPGAPTPEPDVAHDVVRFEGDVYTHGGYLEVFADDIIVNPGKTLSTLINTTLVSDQPVFEDGGNDIVFRARRIGTPEIENLLPSGYISKTVSIDIGTGANLHAGSIYLVAQAEDRDVATQIGVSTTAFLQQGLIGPVADFLSGIVALPIKVLVKDAQATVTVGEYARLLAEDVVGVYATAATDASAIASSTFFSVGYSQAGAKARIDIRSHAVVEGGGAVNVTSDATATAKMDTETEVEEAAALPGRSADQNKGKSFAASLAVTYANVESTATVYEGAVVHGGRTVNVRALGTVESEAAASSGLFADGTAALALALQFSTANIVTTLSGK
ncbi:MAG TPA: hypothetical protein VF491_18580, partial [Vicinamibacterales bacterium]